MANKFQIPDNATFAQISQSLAICSNQMASVSEKCAEHKADMALKQTALKREQAKATVRFSDAKNATLIKAMAEVDPAVMQAQDEYDSVSAMYTIAAGELAAWEAQFVALRKMVAIREIELRGSVG